MFRRNHKRYCEYVGISTNDFWEITYKYVNKDLLKLIKKEDLLLYLMLEVIMSINVVDLGMSNIQSIKNWIERANIRLN